MIGKDLAPLGLLFPVLGVVAWIGTGDWTWAAYGALALVVLGAVGATVDNIRHRRDERERSEP